VNQNNDKLKWENDLKAWQEDHTGKELKRLMYWQKKRLNEILNRIKNKQ